MYYVSVKIDVNHLSHFYNTTDGVVQNHRPPTSHRPQTTDHQPRATDHQPVKMQNTDHRPHY